MKSKAIIYARCSTNESQQDVEVQLKQLRAYCERQGWDYEEKFEYESGFKGIPPTLKQILDSIAHRVYDVMIVHSLDRFSRLNPQTTEKMLNHILDCKCRFISLQENLDSNNQMMWYCFKGVWMYFANQYSRKLSEKTKLGMQRAKEKGITLGRPTGAKDKKKRSNKGYLNRKYNFKVN